jgi:hypothetical protein
MSLKQFYVANLSGEVLRTGWCSPADFASQAGPNEMVYEGPVDVPETSSIDPNDYRNSRFVEYPSVKEQLDAIWHSMNSGVLPKAEPFFSLIKTVKDKYPKG